MSEIPWSAKGDKAVPIGADKLMILDSEDIPGPTQNKLSTIDSLLASSIELGSRIRLGLIADQVVPADDVILWNENKITGDATKITDEGSGIIRLSGGEFVLGSHLELDISGGASESGELDWESSSTLAGPYTKIPNPDGRTAKYTKGGSNATTQPFARADVDATLADVFVRLRLVVTASSTIINVSSGAGIVSRGTSVISPERFLWTDDHDADDNRLLRVREVQFDPTTKIIKSGLSIHTVIAENGEYVVIINGQSQITIVENEIRCNGHVVRLQGGRIEFNANTTKISQLNDDLLLETKTLGKIVSKINNNNQFTVSETLVDCMIKKIINVVDPTADQDAVTKKYSDSNRGLPKIAETVLTVAGNVIDVVIPARRYLEVVMELEADSGFINAEFTFNDDSGAKYTFLRLENNATPANETSATRVPLDPSTIDGTVKVKMIVYNKVGKPTEYYANSTCIDGADATTLPTKQTVDGAWFDNAQVIKLNVSTTNNNFTIGSRVTVYGSID